MYICPKCKEELYKDNKTYKCKNNHSYDINKLKFVNLVLGNYKNSGDNKEMVEARERFLTSGYYDFMINEVINVIKKYKHDNIIDAACGQGYYTDIIYKELDSNIYGVDLSKDAITIASKRNKNINWFISSIFDLPIKDNSFDIFLDIFAPIPNIEASRILKDDGVMIMVSPGIEHLYELKQAIYDNPYKNEEVIYDFNEFELVDQIDISRTIEFNNEELKDLFKMTPYFYKTSAKDQEKLSNIFTLSTQIQFKISTFKKK